MAEADADTIVSPIRYRAMRRGRHGVFALSGFTMVELIVVMVVVGILAVFAVPRFAQLSGFKDVGFRDQVKSAVAYARKAAVARRRHTCLVFDGGSTLTLTAELVMPENHANNCPYTALNLPSGSNTIVPPSNVTISAPGLPLTIQFDAQGRPIVGGGTAIVITDSSTGTTSTLTVETETGYVH